MYFSSVPYCFLFFWIWFIPQSFDEFQKSVYFFVILVLFSISNTSFSVPYYAMLPNLTYDYQERVSVVRKI